MANNLELSLRINANASDAIRSLLETRRSLADLSAQTQTAQQRTADLGRAQQAARQQADELRVQHALASRELAELGSRVSRTSPEYRALSAQVRQLAGDLRSADREATTQTRAFERARNATAELSARMEALQQSSHRSREALRTQGVDVSRLASEYLRLRQAEQQAAAARPLNADAARISQHYQNPAEVQARQQTELNAHLAAGRINQDTYNRALADYNRQAQSGVDQTNRLGSAIRSMGHIAAAVFATHSAFNLGRAIYQTSVDFQRVEGLLTTVTGSAAAATEQLRWLDEISNRLGLDVATTAKQYGFYAASAKEAGFSQDEINRIFYNFTSAISGLQLGQAQAERVMYALTQMTTKPKVALEELQLQLGDSLPGVMRKAARAAGISTDELYDKISKGQLVSSEFIKAFSQVLADDFPALTEGAAQSAARLENAWVKAKLEFGKGGFTDAVAKTLDKLTASIDGQTPALKAWSAALGDVITLLSAHGEEAGIGLSALLAGMRYGPVGAVVAGGTAMVGSAYVDSKKDAPDISLNPADSADAIRKKVAGANYLITQFRDNVFLGADEEKSLIARLEKRKQDLLAALAKATTLAQSTGAKEKFTFDPAKGFNTGGTGGAAQKAGKDLAKSQLDYELSLLTEKQKALDVASQHDLKALANTTAAKALELKRQREAELIDEQTLKQQLLTLEKSQAQQELAIKRDLEQKKADLALLTVDAKIKALGVQAPAGQYDEAITAAQKKYQLPDGLVRAVMQTESQGNKSAVSPAGAAGLMQLMPETAKGLKVTDRFDPNQSIEGGAKLLRQLLDQFNGDIKLALAAYNAKPSTVKKYQAGLGDLPAETKAYVPKVLAEMQTPTATGKASVTEQQAFNAQLKTLAVERETIEADNNAKLDALRQEAITKGIAFDSTELENTRAAAETKKALAAEFSQMQQTAALSELDFKRQMADQELELGKITQEQHLERLRELAAEELALRLKLLEDERKLHPNDPIAQAKISAEQQQVMIEFKGKWSGFDAKSIKNDMEKAAGFFAPLQNAIDQSVNGILTGQQTIANAARNAAQSVVISYIQQSVKTRLIKASEWAFEHAGMAKLLGGKKQFDLLESAWDAAMWVRKRVAKTLQWTWEAAGFAGKEAKIKALKSAGALFDGLLWVKKQVVLGAQWAWETLGFGTKEAAKAGAVVGSEAVQTGAQVAGDVIRTGSTVAAAGTKVAVTEATAKKSILAYALEAAAGAYNALVSIPYVGPIIAPIAAAVAFVGVSAFGALIGSAKGGEWQVGQDGSPYILHEKESVLPAGVADNFRSVVNFVQNRGLKPVDVSAVVGDFVASGQLHSNWTIPSHIANIASQAQAAATKTVENGRAAEQSAQHAVVYQTTHDNSVKFSPVYQSSFIDTHGAKQFFTQHADHMFTAFKDGTRKGKLGVQGMRASK